MKKIISLLIPLALGCMPSMAQFTSAPAFPGAEGHGRYTTGGRGGVVKHVTNLNDSGTGSLREAVKGTSKKIVVFDVSGYIDLKSDLTIGDNTTILGQTAPGDGVTLRYRTIRPGANNIIRFIRIRRSQVMDVNDGADALWQRQKNKMILDHCSFSWSIDEVASFYDNRDFTMQWCNVTEGLANPGHSKGAHSYGGIWGGKNASFHHNFIAHVQNRAPRFNGARYGWEGYDKTKYETTVDAERVDFRNCVMYNWGNGNGCYGGPGGGYVNIVNNYYKAGPGTTNKTRVTEISVAVSGNSDSNHPELFGLSSRYYINGNYVSAAGSQAENYDWKGVRYDSGLSTINGENYIPDAGHKYGSKVTYVKNSSNVDCVRLKLDEPVDAGSVTTQSAETAFTKVVEYAGASFVRDAVDERYANEATEGIVTYTGEVCNTPGILDLINNPTTNENDPSKGTFPTLASEKRAAGFDSDNDGIPDEWELLYGLKVGTNNATTYNLDPKKYYTDLEVYANSLVEDIIKAQRSDALDTFEEYYPDLSSFTAISNVSAFNQTHAVATYNVLGQRVTDAAKGLQIRSGKKFIK